MKYLFILGLIVLIGCVEESVCSPPYIEFQEGECCMDEDIDGICDIDEVVEEVEEKVEADVVLEEEKKIYNIEKAKQVSLKEAKEYMWSNNLGMSPAFTYKDDKIEDEIFTIHYNVKYLINLNEASSGVIKVVYNLDEEKVVSVKFLEG